MNAEIIVALDAMGVVYQPGADVDELLIPFLRERGCARGNDEIVALYNDASRGLLTAGELWERLGIEGDPRSLDHEVVSRYAVTDGLHDFLRWCDEAGVPVACISNDISEWATLRAQRFGLSHAIVSWTISGDVGHRKPDEAIYDAFLATTPAGAACIFVDDRLENVAAAASRGMRGVLFGPAADVPTPGVASVPDFSSLADLVAAMRQAGPV